MAFRDSILVQLMTALLTVVRPMTLNEDSVLDRQKSLENRLHVGGNEAQILLLDRQSTGNQKSYPET